MTHPLKIGFQQLTVVLLVLSAWRLELLGIPWGILVNSFLLWGAFGVLIMK